MSVSTSLSPDKNSLTGSREPSHGAAFRVWLRVALSSFGGPAGQIAMMHRILVEELNWVTEARFLHALNHCMLLPGPEGQQLATYIGWLMHKTRGGIIAGCLFILPGALSAITAAVGGVILNLAIWFAIHTIFHKTIPMRALGLISVGGH